MSFNFNMNGDFYANPNNKNNSPLNFAEHSPNTQPFFDPSGYYSNQQPSTMNDWSQTQFFNPQEANMNFNERNQTDFDQEPPLLEELGINFDHIFRKTKCVLNPFAQTHESIIHDEDLAGPLVFCIVYGFSLLLRGKIQFGYIYGITVLGCLSMYFLLNLMSEKGVNAVCIASTLGYCLLPMVFLSFLSNLITLNGGFGLILSILFIFWCSISSSKLFVNALNMSNQQTLVLYPCFLLYGILALLNVF